jgi:hypothetical protein
MPGGIFSDRGAIDPGDPGDQHLAPRERRGHLWRRDALRANCLMRVSGL